MDPVRLTREEILGRLRSGLPQAFTDTGVVAAYLFGSVARAEATKRSDIDLGIVLGSVGPDQRRLLDLMRRVHLATGLEVDLVLLDGSRLRLLRRILRDGVLVYVGDESARVEFESQMRKLSQDFAIHADRLDREMLAATAAGAR